MTHHNDTRGTDPEHDNRIVDQSRDWPFGYTFRASKTPGDTSGSVPDSTVNDVFVALKDYVDARQMPTYVRSKHLESGHALSHIGRALDALSCDETCPLVLRDWNEQTGNGATVWHVSRRTEESND